MGKEPSAESSAEVLGALRSGSCGSLPHVDLAGQAAEMRAVDHLLGLFLRALVWLG